MGGCQHLLIVMALALIVRGIVVIAGNSGQGVSIQVKHEKNRVFLHCKVEKDRSVLGWSKDGSNIGGANTSKLLVGLATEDPRGLYQCRSTEGNASLQLYFRMCQYCVQLNVATVLGIVVADFIATAALMGAVWCLAAQEPGQPSRASDKQALLASDQLYQPLGERHNGQYSHIGVAKARRR
ncbi:T-cell surface glycoprotein CD3 gamma chain-like [Heteronotia binoei]|uniref:T-cell surface glycoprotein CD3 gamma chain-like n=1 Tax=Heteronotia binoei TaxID=13085 RepID=UPI00292E9121|nr:T-cell surface glycoprotein CD3 gamma chain-like [Heteronotia binoei]